jgi:hypothetical protein
MLDPEAPDLDEETCRRRRVLASLHALPIEELFKLVVRSGIYTEDGELTPPYSSDEPSAARPTD